MDEPPPQAAKSSASRMQKQGRIAALAPREEQLPSFAESRRNSPDRKYPGAAAFLPVRAQFRFGCAAKCSQRGVFGGGVLKGAFTVAAEGRCFPFPASDDLFFRNSNESCRYDFRSRELFYRRKQEGARSLGVRDGLVAVLSLTVSVELSYRYGEARLSRRFPLCR